MTPTDLQLPHRQEGFVVWFTGLSGSGKTTLAKLLERDLQARGLTPQFVDVRFAEAPYYSLTNAW